MLIHLLPQISGPMLSHPAELVELSCEELSLHLDCAALASRRPYPNKNFVVACKRVGQRAMRGLLIETPAFIPEFTVVYRWAIKNGPIATHRVRYVVLDQDYDGVTDDMVLWGNWTNHNPVWTSRYPANVNYGTPMESGPRMQIFPSPQRWGEIKDKHDGRGFIVERSENFYLPTLPRERLVSAPQIDDRIPSIDSAFHASACAAPRPNNAITQAVLNA